MAKEEVDGISLKLSLEKKEFELQLKELERSVTQFVNKLETNFNRIEARLSSNFESIATNLGDSFSNVANSVADNLDLEDVAENISDAIQNAFNFDDIEIDFSSMEDSFSDIGDSIQQAIDDIEIDTSAIGDAIQEGLDDIEIDVSGIGEVIQEEIEGIEIDASGLGESIGEGIGEGVGESDTTSAFERIRNSITQCFGDARNRVAQSMGNIGRSVSSGVQRIRSGFRSATNAIRNFGTQHPIVAGISKKAFSAMSNAARKAGSVIKNAFTGAISRLKNLITRTREAETGFGGLARKLAGFVAAAGLVSFGKSCIDLGSDLAEVQNVVDVTFPHMTSTINDFATNAAAKFGLSETMAKQYTGTFGAMAEAFGFSESAAADMSMTLTGLAGDVASFYNITQDEAYTKLKSVFTGETETLKDLGIVMTQTALDSYALANGYGKVTAKMSEAEKVSLRYAFVQDQLTNATGDFARTADGWANQVRILSLQMDSLKANIGQGLINIFSPVLKVINIVIGKLATLANAFKSFTELITGKKSTASAISDTSQAVDEVKDGLDNASSSADNLANNVSSAGNAADKAAKQMKQLMGFDAINKLSDTSSSSSSNKGNGGNGSGGSSGIGDNVDFGHIEDNAQEATGGIAKAFQDAFNQIKKAWADNGEAVTKAWTDALESVKSLATDIGTTFLNVWNDGTGYIFCSNILKIVKDIGQAVDTFAKSFKTAWDDDNRGYNYIESIFNKWNAMLGIIDSIASSVTTVWGNGTGTKIIANQLDICTNINNTIANLGKNFKTAWDDAGLGTDIIQNLADIFIIIQDAVADITGDLEDWSADIDFGPALKRCNEFLEDLKKGDFKNAGKIIGETLSDSLGQLDKFITKEKFQRALDSVSNAFTDGINGIIEGLDPEVIGKTIFDAIDTAVRFASKTLGNINWGKLGEKIGECLANIDWVNLLADVGGLIMNAIAAATSLAVGVVVGIGKTIVSKIVDGISDAVSNIGTTLKERLIDPMVKGLKENMEKNAKTIDSVGKFFTEDLLNGIARGFHNIGDWIQKNIIKKINNGLKDFGSDVQSTISVGVTLVKNKWSSIKKFVGDKVDVGVHRVKKWSSEISKFVGDKVNVGVHRVKKWSSGISKFVGDKVEVGIHRVKKWSGSISKFVGDKVNVGIKLAKSGWTGLKDWLLKGLDSFKLPIKLPHIGINWGTTSFAGFEISYPKGFYTYAKGGFPDKGEMFVAREAGPELVGKIGNKSTVANNEQIVSSIARGVSNAVTSSFASIAKGLSAPPLASVSTNNNADLIRQLERQTKELQNSNSEMIRLMKQILELIKLFDLTVNVDGKNLVDILVNRINRQTKSTGKCPIIV